MIRLVKMRFRKEEVENFKSIFRERRMRIESFPGCYSVRLLQDREDPQLFFTYSVWRSPEDLGKYRDSELFKETWELTRALFADKAEAWSLEDTMI